MITGFIIKPMGTPLIHTWTHGYPCNTRCFRGHPLQSTQLSPMSYQIPAWVKGRAYLTQNFKKIMIWLVWIMIIAGAFISVNSEQTL